MITILIIILNFSIAHDSLSTTHCENGSTKIKIEKLNNSSYIFYDESKKMSYLNAPKVKDLWDKTKNQMFDTYSFKKQNLDLVLKKPETKGPIKSTIAIFNGKTFKCS